MRFENGVTSVSWIPSEAVTGVVYRVPFEVGLAHYDDPPPDELPSDLETFLAFDRARFANVLRAWIDVEDGVVVAHGQEGQGRIGSTTVRLGGVGLTFAAVPFPDQRRAQRIGDTAVRFEQTAGGRTAMPAPRRVDKAPYLQISAPLAWTSLALTLHADGRADSTLTAASPFPRHWVYDGAGALTAKTAKIDYRRWSTEAFTASDPWEQGDSETLVTEAESALERELSLRIMRAGVKPEMRRLAEGESLTRQGDAGDEIFLLLDGVLRVDVDGEALAEIGPGAVLGERALLESGLRTASLTALTRCRVAVADRQTLNPDLLQELSDRHRREEQSPPTDG